MNEETKIAKENKEINLFAVALMYMVGGAIILTTTLFMILEKKLILEFLIFGFFGALLCWITNHKVQESKK